MHWGYRINAAGHREIGTLWVLLMADALTAVNPQVTQGNLDQRFLGVHTPTLRAKNVNSGMAVALGLRPGVVQSADRYMDKANHPRFHISFQCSPRMVFSMQGDTWARRSLPCSRRSWPAIRVGRSFPDDLRPICTPASDGTSFRANTVGCGGAVGT